MLLNSCTAQLSAGVMSFTRKAGSCDLMLAILVPNQVVDMAPFTIPDLDCSSTSSSTATGLSNVTRAKTGELQSAFNLLCGVTMYGIQEGYPNRTPQDTLNPTISSHITHCECLKATRQVYV